MTYSISRVYDPHKKSWNIILYSDEDQYIMTTEADWGNDREDRLIHWLNTCFKNDAPPEE